MKTVRQSSKRPFSPTISSSQVSKSTKTRDAPRDSQIKQELPRIFEKCCVQACQACFARKKRCVTRLSHHLCTYCFRQGQRCLPRGRPVRSGYPSLYMTFSLPKNFSSLNYTLIYRKMRKYKDESLPEQRRPEYDLPFKLPRGIDHEVPRWSVIYSMFSETLRLIPPEEI
jgi:hypothetical protein